MNATKHIFISYARRDKERVDRLVESLRGAGYSVWIDRGGIPGALLWREAIVVAIRESNTFVLALSPHSVASKNVRTELDLGQQYGKRVVPLLSEGTAIPDDMQYQLIGIQHIDWSSVDGGFGELCRTLKSFSIERLDLSPDAGASAKPTDSWWQAAPGVFGVTAALAAAFVWVVAGLPQGRTGPPSSLTPLSTSLFDGGDMGLSSLGFFGILAILGIVFGYFKSLRPAIVRLAAFFLLTIPLAIWKGQYIAASLGVITAVAIGAWWSRGSKAGIARASSVVHALILLGSVVLGVTTQYLLARKPGGGSIIAVTPFEVADDEGLKRKQTEHSKRMLQKLSAVFSRAGLSVMPQELNEETLNDWSIDNWRVEKARLFEPRLLLRTTLSQCGTQSPDEQKPMSYTWLAEPYGRDLEPLPDFASASGSDLQVLSLHIAFKILTTSRDSIELSKENRDAARRVIVQDALTIARSSGDTAAQVALAQSAIDDQKIIEILEGFTAHDPACDETATKNREAHKAKANSYTKGGP